jgi:hypothetical protein
MQNTPPFDGRELAALGRFLTEKQLPGLVGSVPVRRGGNGRVRIITLAGGTRLVAKQYHDHGPGGFDRLDREYGSLRFLHDAGITMVPVPVGSIPGIRMGIYAYIEGTPVDSSGVTADDIEAVCTFLARVNRAAPAGAWTEPAAEACFSVDELCENLAARFRRLAAVPDCDPVHRDARAFVSGSLAPVLTVLTARVRSEAVRVGIDPTVPLPQNRRMLSPSDFGFHNAIRRPDGTLVFVDFEYFGWDDPAKTVADFLLHPRERCSHELKQRFVTGMLRQFAHDPFFRTRVELLYPLFAVKWSMILLNEFLPDQLARREFAAGTAAGATDRLRRQLAKARRMLGRAGGGRIGYRL